MIARSEPGKAVAFGGPSRAAPIVDAHLGKLKHALPQIELLYLVAQGIAGDAQQARGFWLPLVFSRARGQQAPPVVLQRKPVGGGVRIASPRPRRRTTCCRSARACASCSRWISPKPSTSRGCAAV
jgi:hypothetical protein